MTGSEWLKVLAFVVLFSWYPLSAMHWANVSDPDIWWHMRAGEWMFQNHAIPHLDPFSVTGGPWVAYSWTFEAFIYQVASRWDLVGIVTYTILMSLAIIGILFRSLRTLTSDFWRAAALTLITSLTFSRIFSPRPGLFTTLLFVVVLHILLSTERDGRARRLWLLPLVMLAWANIHIQFVYGLFLIGVFAIDPLLSRIIRYKTERKIPASTLWLVFAASTLATLVNPYGIGIYRVISDFARQPKLYSLVIETQPMKFNHFTHYLAIGMVLLAIVMMLRAKRFRPAWIILLAWATASGIHAERDVWVLAIVAATVIADSLCIASGSERLGSRTRLFGVAGVAVVVLLGLTWIMPTNKELLSRVSRVFPMGSVAYIHEHKLQGPIFNDFNWGGFLIYTLPDMPVSIDGRTNVHGQDRIENSWNTWKMGPNWQNDPNLNRANLIIGEPELPLTKALAHDSRYRVAFNDGVSVLFVRAQ